jgi:bacillithiol biosynthesis deacetylase BshB1
MAMDAMFFGAHPDDVELSAGGTAAKMAKLGYTIGICDLTRGEAGTRGSAELRDKEALDAAKILGAVVRENLSLPDTEFQSTRENQIKVIRIIRKYCPEFVFIPYWDDRHPDHIRASELLRESAYYAGLAKIVTEDDGKAQTAFRPRRTIYCPARYQFSKDAGTPFIVDITDTFAIKTQALEAFSSQFYNPNYQSNEPQTYISTAEFRETIEARARYFGSLIGKKYGEIFLTREHFGIQDPIKLFRDQ